MSERMSDEQLRYIVENVIYTRDGRPPRSAGYSDDWQSAAAELLAARARMEALERLIEEWRSSVRSTRMVPTWTDEDGGRADAMEECAEELEAALRPHPEQGGEG